MQTHFMIFRKQLSFVNFPKIELISMENEPYRSLRGLSQATAVDLDFEQFLKRLSTL